MVAIKGGGFFKGDRSVSGQLCACVLSKPLVHSPTVCSTLTQSTHWRTCCHPHPSRFLSFCIFQSYFLPVVRCYLSFCSTYTVALCLPPVLWPEALCKATRKGLLAMPVCASMVLSIHFRSFPFFSVTCSHNCCCFRPTETHTTWLQGVKNKHVAYFILSVCLFPCCYSLFCVFLPH